MDCFRLRSLSYGGQVVAVAPRNDGLPGGANLPSLVGCFSLSRSYGARLLSAPLRFADVRVWAAFPWKLREENNSRKREFSAGNRHHLIRTSLDARLLIPLRVRQRASTVRSPIRARRANDTTRGQDEDSSRISRSCSLVISICRTSAANRRALPAAFAVQ